MLTRFDTNRDGFIQRFAADSLSGKSVLEIGCGEGDRTKLFWNYASVTGLDITDHGIKNGRGFKFVEGDALDLPFGRDSFDSAVSFDVIEHVNDDAKFCSEAFKVIRPGGYFLVGTPNRGRIANRLLSVVGKKPSYPLELGPGIIHLREYLLDELENKIKTAGFEIQKSLAMWIGIAGFFDLGIKTMTDKYAKIAQYLLVIAKKP